MKLDLLGQKGLYIETVREWLALAVCSILIAVFINSIIKVLKTHRVFTFESLVLLSEIFKVLIRATYLHLIAVNTNDLWVCLPKHDSALGGGDVVDYSEECDLRESVHKGHDCGREGEEVDIRVQWGVFGRDWRDNCYFDSTVFGKIDNDKLWLKDVQ